MTKVTTGMVNTVSRMAIHTCRREGARGAGEAAAVRQQHEARRAGRASAAPCWLDLQPCRALTSILKGRKKNQPVLPFSSACSIERGRAQRQKLAVSRGGSEGAGAAGEPYAGSCSCAAAAAAASTPVKTKLGKDRCSSCPLLN